MMISALGAALSLASAAAPARAEPQPVAVMGEAGGVPRVLVYTRTLGYRHDSIPTAIQVLKEQAGRYGVSFDFTEDPSLFVDETLSKYDNVMFVSTSEEVLNQDGQAALARYFQSGGTFTGVHSASACLFNDTSFLDVVGAYFDYHPSLQEATFLPINKTAHPATAHLPDRWTFIEEVYYFRSDPRTLGASVILTVDENSYHNDAGSAHNYPPMGEPHPIAWYIVDPQSAQPLAKGAVKAGRSFYTSLGHLNETWHNDTFVQHVMNGLTWALDGASTRAYDVGIVGNQSSPMSNSSSTPGVSGTGAASVATGSSTGEAQTSSSSASGTAASPTSAAFRAAPAIGIALGTLALAALL